MKTLEYQEGFQAYCDGKSVCPYNDGTLEWVDWHCGYFDSRNLGD